MATGAPSPQRPAEPVRQRPSVDELSAEQLAELRAAYAAMQSISDDRGFQYFAGLHGLPLPAWCDIYGHGKPTFLHWHRAYLWRFELALRATGHDVTLPWWDWISDPAVPAAFADEIDADGNPNPLYSVRINDIALQQGAAGEGDSRSVELAQHPDTFRQPGLPGTQLPTQDDIDTVLDYSDFDSFSSNLEDWHGAVHIWTGGHMTDVPFAAYDPIFWSHHTMIDRIWRIWQTGNHSASMPGTLAGEVMQPFHLTAEATLDPTALGYDYAVSATNIAVPDGNGNG
jgi:tyrosinase